MRRSQVESGGLKPRVRSGGAGRAAGDRHLARRSEPDISGTNEALSKKWRSEVESVQPES